MGKENVSGSTTIRPSERVRRPRASCAPRRQRTPAPGWSCRFPSAHPELSAVELDVARIGLEEVSGDGARLSTTRCAARETATPPTGSDRDPIRVEPQWRERGVAVDDVDVVEGDAQRVGRDLGERRRVLTVGRVPRRLQLVLWAARVRSLLPSRQRRTRSRSHRDGARPAISV